MAVAHINKREVNILKFVECYHINSIWSLEKEKSPPQWTGQSFCAVDRCPVCGSIHITLCIYNPSSRAVLLYLRRLYCPSVHLGWTQTAPLGAFMPTTMWQSWHFACDWPPQLYSTAAIFSGLSPATKTLGRKKGDMKKKKKEKQRKQGTWLMAFFDLIFCHPRMDDCRLLMSTCPIEE